MKTKKNKNKKNGFAWFLGAGAFAVVALLGCQFVFGGAVKSEEKFYENTKINGIDVGGMSVAEAENVVLTDMLNTKNEIEITLTCNDKSWVIKGNEFEVFNKLQPAIVDISRVEHEGNYFQRKQNEKETKEKGKEFQVSYLNVISNLDNKIEAISKEIEMEAKPAQLVFNPDGENVFEVFEGQNKISVLKKELKEKIDSELKISRKFSVEVPIIEEKNNFDIEKIKNSVGKRSEFSTSYEKSSKERKNNIKKALENFNGMIVEPGAVISFNEVTGDRTKENGYKTAHVIVDGVYVDGVGGGVCQASTTLYNALLLADVDILSVNHHTLPASYVPLSRDAMVSGDFADLVFQNNMETPIYIKTSADDKHVKVEIFGQKLADDEEIKIKTELVRVLPHNGDKVVYDSKGEYSNRVLYKGEYYRVKYPKEGYESKAFLQHYVEGKLESEKEIRHDFYPAQDGIVMEGVEDIGAGMVIPASDVKIYSPQKVTTETENRAREKLTRIQGN